MEKMTHAQINIKHDLPNYYLHQIMTQNEDYSSTTSDRQFIYSERFFELKEKQRIVISQQLPSR